MTEAPIVDVRNIDLAQGGTLTVEMTQAFVDKLRAHYGLLDGQPLEDDHVRMYVWGATKSAVDKAEEELQDDKPQGNARGVRKPRRRKKGQRS